MANALEIRLLGPFEVVAGGRQVDVTGTKRHGLLALLSLHRGRVLGVDELIDALWGSELPASPRNALQHHVARLRAALGQETIVASGDGYALVDASVDALDFDELLGETRLALREGDAAAGAEAVAQALRLWRGQALQGLTDTTWFSGEARRLEALRVDALEEQFEAALALGEHREIVSALRAAVEQNPFRERLWGQLMLALYRSGRQADALESFQDARRVLEAGLGLEPGPDLRRLQEAILTHDPEIAHVPVAPRRGNLPTPPTSFVDREQELAQVVELLREHRLVTLTGPPGVGKSRLAIEVARFLDPEVSDGIWLVDVGRAGGAADVAGLVARAADARGADPLARVIARFRDSDALFVLDGCRRVVDEASRIASAVVSQCPRVRMLATSREVLRVPGGARVHLGPLVVPDSGSADSSGDAPALQLFLERARAARPGFDPASEAVPVAAEITRRLDGLPLAIELVAARVSVLGLGELLSIVEHRLALVHDRPASDPIRTSLQDLVDWSYDLLHTDEQTLLHQLAVHRGGASLWSLLAVGGSHGVDEPTVTYLLGALVDKSIVGVSFPDGEARYDLLDTVRDYVLEQLAESGGLSAARKAHAEYFARLAESARTGLRAPEWSTWMKRLEREHDNLWAALIYARDAPDPVVGARLGVGLGWYFGTAERVSEGRGFIEAALALPDEVPLALRIELLAYLCYLATEDDDLEAAVEAGERGLALATSDRSWEGAMVRLALAFAYDRAGPYERAFTLAEEARRAFDELGDTWGAASSAVTGALAAIGRGDLSAAAALTAEAVHLHADYDVGAIPAALLEGWLAERRNDAEAAPAAYRRALERSERAGFTEHASFALTGLGSLAFAKGDFGEAEARYRRALAVADAASASWLVAHAKARLAQVYAATGDARRAESLCRDVVVWGEQPRRHEAREALFIALAGDPATRALLGLAELADAGGDSETAAALRARAELALA